MKSLKVLILISTFWLLAGCLHRVHHLSAPAAWSCCLSPAEVKALCSLSSPGFPGVEVPAPSDPGSGAQPGTSTSILAKFSSFRLERRIYFLTLPFGKSPSRDQTLPVGNLRMKITVSVLPRFLGLMLTRCGGAGQESSNCF